MTVSPEAANTAYTIATIVSTAIVATFGTLYGVQKYGLPGMQKQQTHSNGSAGSKSVDFWTNEMRDAVQETVRDTVLPILDRQTEILGEMNIAITKLVTIAEFRDRRRND